MSKLQIAKMVINGITGMSTGYCVNQVIANNVSPENTAEYAKAMVGTVVISGMVVGQAREYTDKMVDEAVEAWNKFKAIEDTDE